MSTDNSMKLDIYINYPGHCEKAFQFYEQHLGGNITLMLPHQQQPPHFPAEWKKPILHAIIEIGGTQIRGADIPGAEPMRSAYLTLRLETAEKAEDIYQLLSRRRRNIYEDGKDVFCQPFCHVARSIWNVVDVTARSVAISLLICTKNLSVIN